MKGAISLFGDKLLNEAVQNLQDTLDGIAVERGMKVAKCYSCGGVFWEKSWHQPPDCPLCHRSRVE